MSGDPSGFGGASDDRSFMSTTEFDPLDPANGGSARALAPLASYFPRNTGVRRAWNAASPSR